MQPDKNVNDLRKYLDEKTRLGVATIVINAIVAAKIPDDRKIDGESLGEIRSMIEKRGRNPDPAELMLAATTCDSGNPINEAITLIERIAFRPDHEFWTR